MGATQAPPWSVHLKAVGEHMNRVFSIKSPGRGHLAPHSCSLHPCRWPSMHDSCTPEVSHPVRRNVNSEGSCPGQCARMQVVGDKTDWG